MKIIVQGNCQSRPIATFLSSALPKAVMMLPVVTHLQTDADAESNDLAFAEADLILSQWVTENYHVKHLTTENMKAKFGDKVITWPNAFFIGQNPDVVTITGNSKKQAIGPLDTYHLRTIHKSWRDEVSISDCISSLNDANNQITDLKSNIAVSLDELRQRELLLDVGISDYIEKYWLDKKLFHVFNHPTNALLIELVNRICDFANISKSISLLPSFWPELLNRVIAPEIPSIHQELGFKYSTSTSSKGFALNFGENGEISLGKEKIHSLDSLVENYYSAYECQFSREEDYQFTPRYLQEKTSVDKAA